MFTWRKDSADISGEEPVFSVRYAGNVETQVPTGKGCTVEPLQKLWENAPPEKHMKKITLQISLCGIFMNQVDKKPKPNISLISLTDVKKPHARSPTSDVQRSSRHFSIQDISFCAADKSVNDRIFCWIYRNPDTGKLFLHAVMCSSKEKAQTMASVMSRAFKLAYTEWKSERQRIRRKKVNSGILSSDGATTSKTSTMKNEMVKMMMMMSSEDSTHDDDEDDDNDDDEDGDDNDGVNDNSENDTNPGISWSSTDSFPSRDGDLDLLVAKDAI